MNKRISCQKNSFILFEAILSVILLSIASYSFVKISSNNSNLQYYQALQNHKNHIQIKSYGYSFDGLENATLGIKPFGEYKKILYTQEDFNLVVYTLEKN